jgi:hypothetical protein
MTVIGKYFVVKQFPRPTLDDVLGIHEDQQPPDEEQDPQEANLPAPGPEPDQDSRREEEEEEAQADTVQLDDQIAFAKEEEEEAQAHTVQLDDQNAFAKEEEDAQEIEEMSDFHLTDSSGIIQVDVDGVENSPNDI